MKNFTLPGFIFGFSIFLCASCSIEKRVNTGESRFDAMGKIPGTWQTPTSAFSLDNDPDTAAVANAYSERSVQSNEFTAVSASQSANQIRENSESVSLEKNSVPANPDPNPPGDTISTDKTASELAGAAAGVGIVAFIGALLEFPMENNPGAWLYVAVILIFMAPILAAIGMIVAVVALASYLKGSHKLNKRLSWIGMIASLGAVLALAIFAAEYYFIWNFE
jgi:hypothetical protein